MPLVKKQSGWFWGSKGPFDSKAKALSVARAAYASGYKEQAYMSNFNENLYISEKHVQNSTFFKQVVPKSL
jgi:hypothetical protein